MASPSPVVAYWMPGCSACLRMKEFLQRSGVPFDAVNVDEQPEERAKLRDHGMLIPTVAVGDRYVSGVDLAQVATLIGVPYVAPVRLAPAVLVERYRVILDTGRALIAQMTAEMLAYTLPDRKRPMFNVANQVASVMRAFLSSYELDVHDKRFYKLPPEVQTVDDILARLDETRRLFDRWWERDAFDDPLDRPTPTSWGLTDLHDVLERETWHTAQHVRQLEHVVRSHGGVPTLPLDPATLEGLPLPDGLVD